MIIIENGKSRFTISFSIGSGAIIAQMPSTQSKLKRFEPTTLLSAISLEPFIAAVVLTANSCMLVPNATMVSPIITAGT